MAATLSAAMRKVLDALGLTEASLLAKADAIAVAYPDIAAAEVAFTTWLTATLGTQLSEPAILGLVAQAWSELASGHPGYSPRAGATA